jgi:hypothetical protein
VRVRVYVCVGILVCLYVRKLTISLDSVLQMQYLGLESAYLRDALQEGSVDAGACLPVPRA